jgi:hypothetical protein
MNSILCNNKQAAVNLATCCERAVCALVEAVVGPGGREGGKVWSVSPEAGTKLEGTSQN